MLVLMDIIDKTVAGQLLNDARLQRGLTWASIAETLDTPLIWTIAAALGQHPLSAGQAATLGELLDLEPAVVTALIRQPSRGPGAFVVPTDPTLYRFYEALMVYGPAIKEFVHEEFGDGIMSAINFRLDAAKVEDPSGDRVVVTFDGKFLAYQW